MRDAVNERPSILIVDDDPMLLNLLRLVLQQRGFVVHSASSGQEAVELYRRHHEATALALLDVCMPGLDGPGTLAELRRVQPGLRACFMSGHTGLYGPDDLHARGMLRFYDKPFAVHKLADDLWQLAHEGARQTA